jgi:hypothetical protein
VTQVVETKYSSVMLFCDQLTTKEKSFPSFASHSSHTMVATVLNYIITLLYSKQIDLIQDFYQLSNGDSTQEAEIHYLFILFVYFVLTEKLLDKQF